MGGLDPAKGKILNSAQTGPEAFGSGMAITVSAQKTAKGSDHSNHLVERRSFFWWVAAFNDDPSRMPFGFFEDYAAR